MVATHSDDPKHAGMQALLILPDNEMFEAVCRVLQHSHWHVERSLDFEDARQRLCCRFAVTLCTEAFPGGTWRDVVAELRAHGCPTNLVVVDRNGAEKLWTEVLNGGGYDVLAYPFDPHELFRVVTQAWRHWRHRQDDRSRVPAAAAAHAS